jgi:hypothetical protein
MISVTVPELAGLYWVALGTAVLSVVLETPIIVVPKVAKEPDGAGIGVGEESELV